jgi:hypothetical protein
MEYRREVLDYFERMGVSVILLLRRNVLKRLISIMANTYDRLVKPLNGTHKSHVHSVEEVALFSLSPLHYYYYYLLSHHSFELSCSMHRSHC